MNPSTSGPINMPAIKNVATSGIPIFWDKNPVMVPTARISPQASNVCFAISTAADASKSFSPSAINLRRISTKTPPPFGGGAVVAGSSVRSADRRRHAEMLLEEGDRAAIGELGGLLVIARIVG